MVSPRTRSRILKTPCASQVSPRTRSVRSQAGRDVPTDRKPGSHSREAPGQNTVRGPTRVYSRQSRLFRDSDGVPRRYDDLTLPGPSFSPDES